MKKITTKLISFALVLSMVFSLSVPAFAAENYDSGTITNTQEDIEIARKAYAALTPEAKVIFEESLAYDAEMLKFHITYVDQNFTPPAPKPQTKSVAVAADPMKILMAELSGLGLPSAVLYSLKAMGAGMVTAIADGPLPVGDIMLAAATAGAVAVIAANWNVVSPKWNKIVSAFKKAFPNSATNIVNTFQSLAKNVQKVLTSTPSITVSGKSVTINGVKYNCTTKADSLTQNQQRNKKYFPAVLYGGTMYVNPIHSLFSSTAKLFMYANNSKVGRWATSAFYARGLCGGNNAIWHNTHSSSEGYFFHYHHPSYKNFHCWYL